MMEGLLLKKKVDNGKSQDRIKLPKKVYLLQGVVKLMEVNQNVAFQLTSQ